MRKSLPRFAMLLLVVSLALFQEVHQAAGDETSPVYQQRSTHAGHHWQHPSYSGHGRQHNKSPHSPSRAPVQGSSFQRPYPYHLDYYRMRYGGSYAPYFGNLYGPPQVYAPSTGYYGGYNPGYGNPGFGGGVPNGIYPGQPVTHGQPVEISADNPSNNP